MLKLGLSCLAGILIIGMGGYFAFQGFRHKFEEAAYCLQNQDLVKKIDGCTNIIEAAENSGQNFIRIQTLDLPTAYLNRGYAYTRIAKRNEARNDFIRAINLQPKLAIAYNNLGALDLDAGNLQSAESNLNQATKFEPNLNLAWGNICSLRLKMNEYEKATKVCTRAIELDPKRVDNFINRGESYLLLAADTQTAQDDNSQQRNYGNALSDFDSAIKLSPKEALGYNERCRVLIAKTDYAGAIISCETAIRLKPDMAAAYVNRSLAHLRQNDTTLMFTDLNKAIQLDPKLLMAYNLRSEAFQMDGDFDKALKSAGETITQFPDEASPLSDRAIINFIVGNFHAAADDFSRSLRHENSVYRELWRYLSLSKAGEDGTSVLAQDTDNLKDRSWPYPVVEFYLGRRDSNAMMAAAQNGEQRCEATFYQGEWQMLQRHTSDAAILLKKAVDTCPKSFVEYKFAQAELKRSAR